MFDLGTTILASAEKNPNEIAIAGIDYKFTYSEWFKKIDALSGSLKYLGLKKKEKVITLLQNNFEAETSQKTPRRPFDRSPCKSLQTRLSSAEDQSVNVMSSLVGVYRFEVHNVPDHMVLIRNSVAPVHISSLSGNI